MRSPLTAAPGKSAARKRWEYEMDAEVMQVFHRSDARAAYPSIVASGANACVLHYTDNHSKLKAGDLLLIDAGAEYQMYASDIMRTIPISKRFRSHQRELYEVVLEAQLQAIVKATVGNSWEDLEASAVRALSQGLIDIGLGKKRTFQLVVGTASYTCCPVKFFL